MIVKEKKNSSSLIHNVNKLNHENSVLRQEIVQLTERAENLNEELVTLKHKFITISSEVDVRDLKIGDVFFPEDNKGILYFVSDIKEISFRIEDVTRGGILNLQYPFDTSRTRYFKVTNVMKAEEKENQ